MADFEIAQNDLLPSWSVSLASVNEESVDLTGATVTMTMVVDATTSATPIPTITDRVVAVTDPGPPVDGHTNTVTVVWQTGDTAVPGEGLVQFKAVWPTATPIGPEHIPNTRYFTVIITSSLS